MKNTFTITSIDLEKGHVTALFSVDGKEQTMCDAPINDAEALKAFLSDYGARYEASLARAKDAEPKKPGVASQVGALIGETFTISA